MTTEFIGEYKQRLLNLGFLQTRNGTEKFTELHNMQGAVVNIAILINCEFFKEGELCEFVEGYGAQLKASAENADIKSAIAVFIMFSNSDPENTNAEAKQILSRGEMFSNQKLYEVFWSVKLMGDTCSIDYNKDQPSEVGGLAKTLEQTVKKDKVIPMAKPVQSKNFMLYIFIAINGIAYALMGLLLDPNDMLRMVKAGAIVPDLVIRNGEYYRLLSAMFIHFDFMHLAANMLSLYIFGNIVERYLGGVKFALIYIVSGLAASVACVFIGPEAVTAGASGAAYGLMGAAAVITLFVPRQQLDFYNLTIILVMGVGMSFIMPNVSWVGHIAGLVAGICLGLLFGRRNRSA